MKNTDKNLRTNNKRIIYILLFFLLVIISIGITYYFVIKPNSLTKNLAWINDESGLEEYTALTDKDISLKIDNINSRIKRCRDKLFSNDKLSDKEKNAYKNVLESVDDKILDLNEWELMKINGKEKEKVIYQVFKESRKLERLESTLDPKISERASKFYYRDQPEWEKNTFPNEAEKVRKKINEVFSPFFHKFREELIGKGEEKLIIEKIKARRVKGEITTPDNLQQHIDYLKSQTYELTDEETGIKRRVKPGPIEWEFIGFTGFLKKGEKGEGEVILGETYCDAKRTFPKKEKDGHDGWIKRDFVVGVGPAVLDIKLKKELLFSRLGENNNWWISKFIKKIKGCEYSYIDISWETLIETIAHELAHAVIQSVRWKYKGLDKKGHGPLHSDYTKRIRKMIENSLEYEEFESWWKEKW